MRLISTSHCKEGMKLAKSVYNNVGQVLIHEGVPLTPRMIKRLNELEIPSVYIEDERTKDIQVEEVLTERTRKLAMGTITEHFSKIMKNGKLTPNRESRELGKAFRGMIKEILYDIGSHKNVMSVITDVYSYDHYVFQHSLNVTVYSLALAMTQKYNEKQLIELGLGALLHDVGKLTVPHEILMKPGELTEEEFAIVKKHTTNGFDFLRKVPGIPLLTAHCAFQHHERLDGSGYPRGIAQNDIHEYAKIIAIADVFDALTSKRSYRKAKLPHVAMEIIHSKADQYFDISFVHTFSHTISMYPIGTQVTLSDFSKGIVVDHNRKLPSRPVVRILKDAQGVDLDHVFEVDLSKRLSVVIKDCEAVL